MISGFKCFMATLAAVLLLQVSGLSQYSLEFEPVFVHYEDINGEPLSGKITYAVYAVMENDNDWVSALSGTNGSLMSISTDCECYNHPLGGTTANNIIPILLETPGQEALAYDTWWTIESTTNEDNDTQWALNIVEDADGNTQGNQYNEICSDVIVDGVLFHLTPDPQGFADADGRVLIGQITACGEVCADVTIQVFPDGIAPGQGVDVSQFTHDLEETCIQNPCEEFPIDSTFTLVDDIDCFGELATIEFNGGGNGDIEYQLWSADVDGNPNTLLDTQTSPTFEDLAEGDYVVSMIDDIGCRDTSALFSFVEPAEVVATMTPDLQNNCFGDNDSQICVDVVGGTGDYTIELLDCDDAVITNIANNACFENIACVDNCGDFTVRVQDENQCTVTEDFLINCPAEISSDLNSTPIECAGLCTGTITGIIEGGSGDLTVSFVPELTVPDPGPSPLNLNITDICAQEYVMTVTDANGCTFIQEFNFEEPDAINVTYDIVDAVCFGDCNGSITPTASGGTPDYTFEIIFADGTAVPNENALCAGQYFHITTDAEDCQFVSDTLEVQEPEEITFTTAVTNIQCAGELNGEICIEDLTGGQGTIVPSLVPTNGSYDNPSMCFQNLPAGTYSLTLQDDFCSVTENGIEVTEPDPIVISLTPTAISCFGANDGIVNVQATGGTGAISIIPDNTVLPTDVTGLAPGAVTITVQDENQCEASEAAEIEEPELLEASVLSTSNIGCGGECDGSADILITGGTGDYSVTFNGEELNLFALCADTYTDVVVSDENNCEALVSFEIIQPLPIEIEANVTPVTCTGMNDGEILAFANQETGTGPITLVLEPDGEPQSTLIAENLFEGEYLVTATDSIGCTADTLLTVEAAIITDMTLTMFSSPVSCWQEGDGTATAAVTGGTEPITWQWNDPAGQTTTTAVALDEEIYTVVVTDAIGCTLSDVVEVEPTEGCFFIATALTPNDDGFNDTWTIGGLEFFPQSNVKVFNRWGQVLFESEGYDSPWDGKFNGRPLPVADYYFIINYDDSQDPITGTVTIKY